MVKLSNLVIIFLVLLFSVSGMLGCVQSFAPVNNQILLEGEKAGDGDYKVGGLSLSYDYETIGSKMHLKGVLVSKWIYNSILVRVFFFDESSALLKQKIVYYSPSRRSLRSGLVIDAVLDVPTDATGMAFKVVADQWADNK